MLNYLNVLGSYEFWYKELRELMYEELAMSPDDYDWPWADLWTDDYLPDEALSEFLLIGKHQFTYLVEETNYAHRLDNHA